MKEDILKALDSATIRENVVIAELKATDTAHRLAITRAVQLVAVQAAGRRGDIATIVAGERIFLQNELEQHANSAGMKGSLTTALEEISAIERHLPLVADPAQYQAVNNTHLLKGNRKGGLPDDEARQAFRSQIARLGNLDKSRLSLEEKSVLAARRRNFQIGEALYQRLQQHALGLVPPPPKARARGLGIGD
jgi:hypothetical protein